jgi:FSR family fosmidomycin resistance protein-like MFS transporter
MDERGDASAVEPRGPVVSGSPLLLAMVITLHAMNHMTGGALPVLYPAIQDEFGLSYVELGFLRSASSFASGFPQMFVGGFRRWISGRVLIGLGNLLNALMAMLSSLVGGFHQFLVLRVAGGLFGSPQHPIGTSILTANTHPSWRGRVFSINLAAPTLASTLSPLVAAWLLMSIGWRRSLVVMAIPALLASLVTLFFVREQADSEAKTRSFSLKGLKMALGNRNVMAISSLRTVMAFRMGVRAFIPLYFIDALGMSTALSSTLYSIMIFGGVVGPFFWGYLSDRMARKPLVIGVLAAQGVLFYSLQLLRAPLILAAVLFLIGFMSQTVIMQSILADSIERQHLDQVFGFYYTLGFTLGSVSSVIFAYVVETLGFAYGFTYIAAVTAVSLVPALFIRE